MTSLATPSDIVSGDYESDIDALLRHLGALNITKPSQPSPARQVGGRRRGLSDSMTRRTELGFRLAQDQTSWPARALESPSQLCPCLSTRRDLRCFMPSASERVDFDLDDTRPTRANRGKVQHDKGPLRG